MRKLSGKRRRFGGPNPARAALPGVPGEQGADGAPGMRGPQGEPGPHGLPGPRGERGPVGPAGAEAPRGLQGIPGPEGPRGRRGETGIAGPPGPPGETGSAGMQGPPGEAGSVGPPGPTGPTGQAGPQGAGGAQGPQGPQGQGAALFANQSDTTASLLPLNTTVALELPPIATSDGQSVKLDSTLRVSFATSAANVHNITVSYDLLRTGTAPGILASAPVDYSMQTVSNATVQNTLYPAITWVDTPPAGTHTYRIEATATAASASVTALQVTNRGLNAVAQISYDPSNIYVEAGATGGNGTRERPFGTIEEGMAFVAEGGTVHILAGTYAIADQLVVTRPMTLLGRAEPLPQIVFDPGTTTEALVIRADDVTVQHLHLIADRAVTSANAIIQVPMRTTSPITLYNNFTLRLAVVEGTTRSGYFWANNLTIEDTEFIHRAVNTQSLRLQLIRGETNILNNVFRGGSTSVGAIVIEPNVGSWTSSGAIRVAGNTMTSFTQFVNFFPHLAGPTSLVIENNSIDHQSRSGSSVILFSRVNYSLIEQLRIQNNRIVNPNIQRLAVYYAPSDGNFFPEEGQVQLYDNTFDIARPWGRPTDTVSPDFPVGFAAGSPQGMSLDAFDLQGNVNV